MNHKRVISSFLLIVVITVSFTGCINKESEISSRLVIQGIGVDKDDNGKYKLSLQVFNTAVSGGQDSGNSGNVTKVYTVEGDSLADCMRNATLVMGRRPLYSQNWIVVISEEIARNGISSSLDFFVRDYGMRSTVSLILSSTTAEDIIRSECGGSAIPAREINSSLEMWKYNSKITDVDIYEAVNFFNDPLTEMFIPIVRRNKGEKKEEDTVVIDGIGVFSGEYLKDKLQPEEIRGFMFIKDEVKSGELVAQTQETGKVTLEIIRNKTKIKTLLNNGSPFFDISIKCVFDINEIENTNAMLNEKTIRDIEKSASEEIQNQSQSVLNRCIKDLNSDIFRFGDRFMRAYPKEFKKSNTKWNEWLPKVEYKVSIESEIRRIGQKTAYTP